jgi:hypothetical protein
MHAHGSAEVRGGHHPNEVIRGRKPLWVIPFLAAVLGPVLAQLTVLLDRSIQVPEAWQYSASTATGVLSVLVGAMVGLIGFVVTIGVLVVQLATGTLSPRFMRLWYRDPLQKVVLAMFAGTLTFSFSLLRHVKEASVPNIGVTAAGLLVAASLLLLLLYLDRFTHSLRPVAVAALVADAGRRVIETMPVQPVPVMGTADSRPSGIRAAEPPMVVRAARSGAIQAIDRRGLLALARRHGCLLVLLRSVGDFVPAGASLVQVFGPAPATAERRLRRMFALGRERTIEQDPAFALRILVDIAIRALSPAVNDPTTAVQVLDYIEDLLVVIGRRDLGGRGRLRDANGHSPCHRPGATLGAVPRARGDRDPPVRRHVGPGEQAAQGRVGGAVRPGAVPAPHCRRGRAVQAGGVRRGALRGRCGAVVGARQPGLDRVVRQGVGGPGSQLLGSCQVLFGLVQVPVVDGHSGAGGVQHQAGHALLQVCGSDHRPGLLDQGLGVVPVLAADRQDGPLGQGDGGGDRRPVSWATRRGNEQLEAEAAHLGCQ